MDPIPSALQIGSPALGGGSAASPTFPSPPTRASVSQDRAPQYYSSRSSPFVSTITERNEPNKRFPYPAPLTPTVESTYSIPDAPAPPSFPASTSYNPSAEYFAALHPEPVAKPSHSRTLFSKLGSIRSTGLSKQSRYNALHDDDEDPGISKGTHHRLREVEEGDDEDPIGFDISGFEGPIALQNLSGKRSITARAEHNEHHMGVLGGGMDQVLEAAPIGVVSQRSTHRRGHSFTAAETRDAAQRAAQKTGEILAVSEPPAVDISNLGGAEYESRNVFNTLVDGTEGESKKSYYFPPDPDMPAWRPFSMRWPYISMLILMALALAGLQEYLCQISMRKVREDNSGLLEFYKPQDLSVLSYFTWKYAPTMVLVTYGVIWQISDFEVKRLEPFYQLSKPTGATAAESLNMDYLTFMSYLVPLRAIRWRQWAVVYSSMGTLLAGSLVPVLQSASVNMYPEKKYRKEGDPKYVRIDPAWSRPLSAALVCVAVCGVLLLFQLRRKSGLLCDPKGIAGIAAMATRSHILNDFNGLDTADHNVIHKQLRNRRYILHNSSLWQGEYIRQSKENHEDHKAENPNPIMLTLKAGIPYITFMLFFAILIPVFMFVPRANIVTEKLPFLLTAIATVIKLLWGTLNCDVRMVEPFYILSRRHAPPQTLTLDYSGTMPGWISIKAFINGHYIVSLVGLGAIMTEVLTVCVSSFSVDGKRFFPGRAFEPNGDQADDRYNSDETFKSFWVSFGLAIGILLSMCLIASLVYLRRRHHFLPRQPGTIASVLAFIHQSKMLIDFVETERKDSRQMTRYLESLPKTYAIGWFSGRDGEDHCGIDEEEIEAPYQHGVDWTKGRVRGGHIGTWDVY